MPAPDQLPHLIVEGRFSTEKYTYAGPVPMGEVQLPVRDRLSHGNLLRQQLVQARQQNEQLRGVTATADCPARIVLEVRSEPDFELALDGLEPRSQGVELACVRDDGGQRVAVLHVPEGKLLYFVKRVEQYLSEQARSGKPKNQDLLDRIAEIRIATLRSFWTDEGHDFPSHDRPIWWEVWLRSESDQGPWDTFRMLAEAAGPPAMPPRNTTTGIRTRMTRTRLRTPPKLGTPSRWPGIRTACSSRSSNSPAISRWLRRAI